MATKRNALVGYLTVMVGRRVAERVVRRRIEEWLAAFQPEPKPSRLRRLPVLGAAVAAGAALAVMVTRQRG